jgi:hypothetical protein
MQYDYYFADPGIQDSDEPLSESDDLGLIHEGEYPNQPELRGHCSVS